MTPKIILTTQSELGLLSKWEWLGYKPRDSYILSTKQFKNIYVKFQGYERWQKVPRDTKNHITNHLSMGFLSKCVANLIKCELANTKNRRNRKYSSPQTFSMKLCYCCFSIFNLFLPLGVWSYAVVVVVLSICFSFRNIHLYLWHLPFFPPSFYDLVVVAFTIFFSPWSLCSCRLFHFFLPL